ncbi:hypothetical protein EVAR_76698_1 [Eumeta japonica]|uniref:Uncharacterized protein n=1 Tax=Eumeta variegata TaxID=151549 RepID=A0A4C1SSX4_EUMVA|nr:hypothetical protein EVAR_76698_1 [Eumeta japonica]
MNVDKPIPAQAGIGRWPSREYHCPQRLCPLRICNSSQRRGNRIRTLESAVLILLEASSPTSKTARVCADNFPSAYKKAETQLALARHERLLKGKKNEHLHSFKTARQ